MAIFGESPYNDLDYQILQNGGISMYRNHLYLEEDIQWLTQNRYLIYHMDCTTWVSEAAMHESLQKTLSFPAYYRGNRDALDDCMPDLDIPEDGGASIVLHAYDEYAKGPGSVHGANGSTAAEGLLDIFAGASRRVLLFGKRLITLVQSEDPRIRFDRLGGVSAQWNRREWLNKDRGL